MPTLILGISGDPLVEPVIDDPPRAERLAPLQERMERFTHRVAIFVGCAVLVMASILLIRGMPISEIFLSSVALAAFLFAAGAGRVPETRG